LSVADNSLLGVLPDAVDRAGGWPAVQLAVVYAGRTMGQALRASRVARRVAVCDEAELALLRCVQRPVEVRAQWWLPASTAAASRCRSAARLRLATWSLLDEDAMRALVVLNELVVNAVLHAGTAVQVGLVLDEDALWVRVRDFSCGPVSRSQRGLGLGLVNALATQWGYEPREDGKTAWARLDRSPAVDL
jgi:anti-sigma regulatory factor (Ser/Thr protein kinase)